MRLGVLLVVVCLSAGLASVSTWTYSGAAVSALYGGLILVTSGDSANGDFPEGVEVLPAPDLLWEAAPVWPFRGMVGFYGGAVGFDWVYDRGGGFGLQYRDTDGASITAVKMGPGDSHGMCGPGQMYAGEDGVEIEYIRYHVFGGVDRVRFMVPWGDYAYPQFLPTENVRRVSSTKAGTDGTHYGFRFIPDEPACGPQITYIVFAETGDLRDCGWANLGPVLVTPEDISNTESEPELSPTVLEDNLSHCSDKALDLRDLSKHKKQ
ncbi:MAG: hypothetical protein OXI96_06235 [Acidimicrobiaceae bacterium]|nr:hypothetical protein [Acidimicrobiaceae bacterium]